MTDYSTKRYGYTTAIMTAPGFDGPRHRPGRDATIWRVKLTAARAFKLVCDLEHLYANPEHRPRVGGMLEADGEITLYFWPTFGPNSALLMLLLDYGAARLIDASRWTGQAWMSGDLLGRALAALATRAHWDFAERIADRYWREPPKLADELPGWLLSLSQQADTIEPPAVESWPD